MLPESYQDLKRFFCKFLRFKIGRYLYRLMGTKVEPPPGGHSETVVPTTPTLCASYTTGRCQTLFTVRPEACWRLPQRVAQLAERTFSESVISRIMFYCANCDILLLDMCTTGVLLMGCTLNVVDGVPLRVLGIWQVVALSGKLSLSSSSFG